MSELESMGLLLKIAQYDITGIKLDYSGDEKHPGVDAMCFTKTKDILPEAIHHEIDCWNSPSQNFYVLGDDGAELYTGIEKYFDENFAHMINSDWCGEGGYGSVSISIPSGLFYIKSVVRVMDTTDHQYRGEMIKKQYEAY